MTFPSECSPVVSLWRLAVFVISAKLRTMKLPMHTTSLPVKGTEARRVLRLLDTGRAVTNPRAKAFAAEIVAELKGSVRPARKRTK